MQECGALFRLREVLGGAQNEYPGEALAVPGAEGATITGKQVTGTGRYRCPQDRAVVLGQFPLHFGVKRRGRIADPLDALEE